MTTAAVRNSTIPRLILVTGGRDFADPPFVHRILSHYVRGKDALLNGGCPTGVDAIARSWAKANQVYCITEHADWEHFGKSAGPIRNQLMIDKHRPYYAIIFPGGRGTADMRKRIEKAGIGHYLVRYP